MSSFTHGSYQSIAKLLLYQTLSNRRCLNRSHLSCSLTLILRHILNWLLSWARYKDRSTKLQASWKHRTLKRHHLHQSPRPLFTNLSSRANQKPRSSASTKNYKGNVLGSASKEMAAWTSYILATIIGIWFCTCFSGLDNLSSPQLMMMCISLLIKTL